jgi:hypothetical protein
MIKAMSRPAIVLSDADALAAEMRSARWIYHRLLDFEDQHQAVLDDAANLSAPGIVRAARTINSRSGLRVPRQFEFIALARQQDNHQQPLGASSTETSRDRRATRAIRRPSTAARGFEYRDPENIDVLLRKRLHQQPLGASSTETAEIRT